MGTSFKMNRTGEELFRRFESHFERDSKARYQIHTLLLNFNWRSGLIRQPIRYRNHFENHSKQLQRSILKEKHKRKEKQVTCCDLPKHKCIVPAFRAHKHSCKMDSHMKNCTVASQWTNCKCSKTPNSLNKNSPLSKTKGIKMTQKRYQEVVNGKEKV